MADVPQELAARLYALPPEDFIAARDEAAAEARQAGDRERATAIGKLRRPTVAAWLINLLALRRPDLTAELLALGEELRRAQRDLRGADLRELSDRRRRMVSDLTAQARRLALAAARPARDNLPLAEVEATLTAALADAEVAREVREGRLLKAATYAGFGEEPRPVLRVINGGASAPEAPTPDQPAPARPAPDQPAPDRPAPVRSVPAPEASPAKEPPAKRERPRKADKPKELEVARTRMSEAESALDGAAAAERAAVAALDEANAALTKARDRHAAAQLAVSQAKLRRKGAERTVQAARRQLTTLSQRMSTPTGDAQPPRPAESPE